MRNLGSFAEFSNVIDPRDSRWVVVCWYFVQHEKEWGGIARLVGRFPLEASARRAAAEAEVELRSLGKPPMGIETGILVIPPRAGAAA